MADDRDLEAILARAYSAIAEPDSIVDLLDALSGVEATAGGLGQAADLHFNNAADILENVYPNDDVDHAELVTRQTVRLDCDLALDATSRIVSANANIFTIEAAVLGVHSPDWLFDPVTGPADRTRLGKLEAGAFGGFVRLYTSAKDEKGRWFTARAHDTANKRLTLFDAVRLRWSDRSGNAFRDALSLTATEISLVRHMVSGGTTRQFAEERGRSLGTARNQLKALQRKLSVNSKEEILLLYAGFLHSLELPTEKPGVETHLCHRHFKVGGDECIAWEEHGDPGGIPLLFFHPIEGALLPAELASTASRHGLRIIAPWRPFYGETTGKSRGLAVAEEFADRLPAFLDHLGINACDCITTHAGSPYMLAFVQRQPARVRSAIGIGGYLPVHDAQGLSEMRSSHRRQLRLVRIAPSFAKIYQRAMLATIGTGQFHRFVEEFYQGCARELAVIQNPSMVRVLRSAATYVVRGRFMGTAETMVTWSADWSRFCQGIEVPVHMLYGTHDATVARSTAYRECETFGFEAPEFIDDAGSFLMYDQPNAVWSRVKEIASR